MRNKEEFLRKCHPNIVDINIRTAEGYDFLPPKEVVLTIADDEDTMKEKVEEHLRTEVKLREPFTFTAYEISFKENELEMLLYMLNNNE